MLKFSYKYILSSECQSRIKNPSLIGFGVFNNQTFTRASHFANGAIIGSQFIRVLQNADNLEKEIASFVDSVREPEIEYV